MIKNSNSGRLLIFDFDNTITNQHMHNFIAHGKFSDYSSGTDKAVTKENREYRRIF
jgi:phosphoserine phosphatase